MSLTTRFQVNTTSGFYELCEKDLAVLKSIGALENLISFHYESPVINMGGMRGGKFRLETYTDPAPEGMAARLENFNDEQEALMSRFFHKLAGKINFAGTKIYLTHIHQVNQLEEASKLIESDIEQAYLLDEKIDRLSIHFLPYQHICADIIDQLPAN